jgi:hypothetical protein
LRPTTLVLTGPLDAGTSQRVDGLIDHLAAEGFKVAVVADSEGVHDGVRAASLVVLVGGAGAANCAELIAARTVAERPTVLDLGPRDLVVAPAEQTTSPALTSAAEQVARACGLVSAPAGALETVARSIGGRVVSLPTLLTRAEISSLGYARAALNGSSPTPTIGWRFGSGPARRPPYIDAVIAAFRTLFTDGYEIEVTVDDGHASLLGGLRRHDQVTVSKTAPDAECLAGWTLQLYTPPVVSDLLADDARDFFEAGLAGTPSVLPLAARRGVAGHPSPQLVVRDVQDPQAWLQAINHLILDPHRRERRVDEATRHAATVAGAAASRAAANRFIGWAMFREER